MSHELNLKKKTKDELYALLREEQQKHEKTKGFLKEQSDQAQVWWRKHHELEVKHLRCLEQKDTEFAELRRHLEDALARASEYHHLVTEYRKENEELHRALHNLYAHPWRHLWKCLWR